MMRLVMALKTSDDEGCSALFLSRLWMGLLFGFCIVLFDMWLHYTIYDLDRGIEAEISRSQLVPGSAIAPAPLSRAL